MAINDLFKQPLKVINVGLVEFWETLTKNGVEVRQVEIVQEEEHQE